MKIADQKGMFLAEMALVAALFSIIILIFVVVFADLHKNIIKTQQLNDLQGLNRASLAEIANQLRQAIAVRTSEPGDIQPWTNFDLAANSSDQVCIYVPKLNNPGDRELADRIVYRVRDKKLVQQLITYRRNMSNEAVVDTVYPEIPIVANMESYRAAPAATVEHPLLSLYNNPRYQYDCVTFCWAYKSDPEDPRGVMAIGISVSGKFGFIRSRNSTTTVVTSRTISGVPR